MMMGTRIAAIVVPLVVLGLALGDPILWQYYASDGIEEFDLTGVKTSTTKELLDWFKNEPKVANSTRRIVIVEGFRTVNDAFACARVKPVEITYARWREIIQPMFSHPPSAVRITKVGRDVVVQTASKGKVTQSVIAGHNPLEVDVSGHHLTILTMHANNQWPQFDEATYSVYLRSSPMVSPAEAAEVAVTLQRILQHDLMDVWIRPDIWFFASKDFPWWYPFCDPKTIPSLGEINSGKTIGCSADAKAVRCRAMDETREVLRRVVK